MLSTLSEKSFKDVPHKYSTVIHVINLFWSSSYPVVNWKVRLQGWWDVICNEVEMDGKDECGARMIQLIRASCHQSNIASVQILDTAPTVIWRRVGSKHWLIRSYSTRQQSSIIFSAGTILTGVLSWYIHPVIFNWVNIFIMEQCDMVCILIWQDTALFSCISSSILVWRTGWTYGCYTSPLSAPLQTNRCWKLSFQCQ